MSTGSHTAPRRRARRWLPGWRVALQGALAGAAVYCVSAAILVNALTNVVRTPVDEARAGVEYERVAFPAREDGTALRGWLAGDAAGEPVVIIVHGLGGNRALGPGPEVARGIRSTQPRGRPL